MQLSPHFTLAEMTRTSYPYDNTPNEFVKSNLRYVATKLEKIREVYNMPIYIESGYRSPPVNTVVGGSRTSLHLVGLAVDIRVNNLGYKSMISFLRAILDSDPCELHFNSANVIHIGYNYKH